MLYLISLDDAHARLASMSAQLQAHGLAYQRIGVDFRRSSIAQIDAWIAARFPGLSFDHGDVSTAEIGCWASHLCAWQALAASDEPVATVLEDDVTLDDAFNEAVETLTRDPQFDLVFLGTSSRNVSAKKSAPAGRFRLHSALGTIYNTWGYVVTRDWARRFFARGRHIDRPIDHYTGGRRAGAVKPRVAVLRPAAVREHETLGPVSQIEPYTYRIDRARIVESARRRIIASRVSALYYKLYDYL